MILPQLPPFRHHHRSKTLHSRWSLKACFHQWHHCVYLLVINKCWWFIFVLFQNVLVLWPLFVDGNFKRILTWKHKSQIIILPQESNSVILICWVCWPCIVSLMLYWTVQKVLIKHTNHYHINFVLFQMVPCCRDPTLKKCEDDIHTPDMGTWGVLQDSQKFGTWLQGSKHLALKCSLYHWKGLEA